MANWGKAVQAAGKVALGAVDAGAGATRMSGKYHLMGWLAPGGEW